MEIGQFKKLLANGFDVEFNIKNIFYSFTKSIVDGKEYYFIGNENYSISEKFSNIDEMLNYEVEGEKLLNVVIEISEEEICY